MNIRTSSQDLYVDTFSQELKLAVKQGFEKIEADTETHIRVSNLGGKCTISIHGVIEQAEKARVQVLVFLDNMASVAITNPTFVMIASFLIQLCVTNNRLVCARTLWICPTTYIAWCVARSDATCNPLAKRQLPIFIFLLYFFPWQTRIEHRQLKSLLPYILPEIQSELLEPRTCSPSCHSKRYHKQCLIGFFGICCCYYFFLLFSNYGNLKTTIGQLHVSQGFHPASTQNRLDAIAETG